MITLKDVVIIIGYFGTVAGFITALRNMYKRLGSIIESQKCELRSDITSIYYNHVDEDEPTLREYERKNLDSLYAGYDALSGNSFIKDIYTVMRTWKVVT